MENFEEMFPKRIITGGEPLDSRRVRDLKYNSAGGEDYCCDVYLPDTPACGKGYPVMIMVHGESPAQGLKDMGYYISVGEMLAARGISTVSFNHRTLMAGNRIGEAIEDIEIIRDFVDINASRFDFDTSKVAIWSVSMGMPYGMYNALNYRPDDVKCIVGYYGVGDFATLLNITQGVDDYYRAENVIKGGINSPILIARAGLDYEFINESLDRFLIECLKQNACVEVYNHPAGHHAFDLLDDNSRTHEIVNRTFEFIERHLCSE